MQYDCPNKGGILQITFLFDTRINLVSCQREERKNRLWNLVRSSFDLAQDERMKREGQDLKYKVSVYSLSIAKLLGVQSPDLFVP